MANISDAEGEIYIEASSKEVLESVYGIFKSTEGYEYSTYIDDNLDDVEYDEEDGVFTLSSGFGGYGRWAYQENIEHLFQWTIDSLSEEMKELLTQSNFSIEFDFEDYECGCDVHYHSIMKLTHEKGVPLLDVKPEEIEYDELDNSWGTRLKEELESEEYMVDMLLESESSYVFSFLNEECDGLEEYFGESLEDLFSSEDEDWREIGKKYLEGKNEAEKK